jgi:hypothetical protein
MRALVYFTLVAGVSEGSADLRQGDIAPPASESDI